YNDLFEIFVGLNPNAKDTDKDGINDFEDSNPKYKSAESEFTAMYEAIADEPAKSEKYSFTEILTDCDYFQNINPKNRKILIYNTEEQYPIKYDVLDNFFTRKYGKIGTSKFYPDVYLIDFSDEVGNGTFSAELINNQWKVGKKYTITFGM
ncbi:MAG: hypothetical protein Q4G16_05865, partial [Cruoricaptor ignavus]|nr:hypothetical protein [Cruoricaptor ignavus]